MTPGTELAFVLDGPVRGKGRPQFSRRGNYVTTRTPEQTRTYEAAVADAWARHGSIRLPDGPIHLDLLVVVERPTSHHKRNGQLSAEGLRNPSPTSARLPDLDNQIKVVADALNGRAWTDDRQVVSVTARRAWAPYGKHAHLRVHATALTRPISVELIDALRIAGL